MEKERLRYLFYNYINKGNTAQEETELMHLLADPSLEEERKKLVDECFDNLPERYLLNDDESDRIFRLIVEREVTGTKKTFPKRRGILTWMIIASTAAMLLLFAGIRFLKHDPPLKQEMPVARVVIPVKKPLYKNDIKPGGNKAILTLADGTKINLDNASNGTLTRQGNAKIIKLESGRLVYDLPVAAAKLTGIVLHNTISTPRGGQYCITLPDGSVVWLNAATTLTFPTTFTGKSRIVEIKGEAYFEVAKNAVPFIVKAGNSEIKVLGTHFNVMAYEDERVIKTTLLEGSVEVSIPKHLAEDIEHPSVILHPGQQVHTDKNHIIKVLDVDTEETIAWKNGYFLFNNENIGSIMSKISRWYDVKVIFQFNPENKDFSGNVPRTQNVSEVLSMLELTDVVHFKIEGKTITVLP